MHARSWLVGLLALVTTSATAATPEEDALLHLNDGVAHYQRGELEAARTDFSLARDRFPERANPHRWLGLTEARLDHCEAAIVELDSFLQAVPPRDPRVPEAIAVRDLCRSKRAPPAGPTVSSTMAPIPPPAIVAPAPPRRRPRYWIAGVVIGVSAAVGLAIGLGVGLTRPEGVHAYPAVSAPP